MEQEEKKGETVVVASCPPPETDIIWNIWQIENIWLQIKLNVLLGGKQIISLGGHFLQKPKESDKTAGCPRERGRLLGLQERSDAAWAALSSSLRNPTECPPESLEMT